MAITFLDDDQLPPIPPADLVYRVVPAFDAASSEAARQAFHEYARSSVLSLERALAVIGRELATFERILDFGCGPGRIMRHLGPLAERSVLHGVDVDADAIAWCSEQIPFAQFAVGPHEPPLPYPDDAFDLIFNHSVFTHLDETRQDQWLAELRRVLAPGGIALLTVHSTRQWNQALAYLEEAGESSASYRERIARDGILFIHDDAFVGSTHPEWYHSTFHAPWYVHQHWAKFFRIRAYIPEGADTQDMVVLEREPAHDAMLEPIPPGVAPAVGPGPAALARSLAGRLESRFADRVAAQRGLSARIESLERTVKMLSTGAYQQAQRTSIVERELRAELEALRGERRS
jgi:SAM-dependent methyltransferase